VPKLVLLNGNAVHERYPSGLPDLKHSEGFTDVVSAAYRLSRGSVFLADPEVTEPFAFLADVGAGKRAHVVVAREYGDVAWPAWLANQRRRIPDEIIARIRVGYSDWLKHALSQPLPDDEQDDDQ
jgi:hypothetical protein